MSSPVMPGYPGVISTAGFWSSIFNYDPLYADATISQSAVIAGGLGVLKRGQVLFGPAPGVPITASTPLTTATGGTARCILAVDIDTTGGPKTGLVYTAGSFLDTAMTFTSQGAALDAAQLWQFSAFVLTVLQRSGLLVPMINLPTTGGPLPQNLAAAEAKKATQQEVEAIRAAIQAFRPGMESVPIAGMGPARKADPAWAIAAFGESEKNKEDEAKEQLAEKADELAQKQQKELDELKAKHDKETAELAQQLVEERKQLDKEQQDTLKQARQQDAQEQAQQHSKQQEQSMAKPQDKPGDKPPDKPPDKPGDKPTPEPQRREPPKR